VPASERNSMTWFLTKGYFDTTHFSRYLLAKERMSTYASRSFCSTVVAYVGSGFFC
jgi:hypothetical protein